MEDQGGQGGDPPWVDGALVLEVVGPGAGPGRIVRIERPFALIGRDLDCDVVLDDPAVEGRHAYLHLDRRGLFAVDLLTHSGTRLDGSSEPAGWLAPGLGLEVAGRRVEVLRLEIDRLALDPPATDDDPLGDEAPGTLVAVALEPEAEGEGRGPLVLESGLVFLGRSGSCGIRVEGPMVGEVHCVLVRAADSAYVVDLCGRATRVGDRALRRVTRLRDGDRLAIGEAGFTARIGPEGRPSPRHDSGRFAGEGDGAPLVAHVILPELEAEADRGGGGPSSRSRDLVPVESQAALLSWVVETVRDGQAVVLRQQAEMQVALAQLVRQIQQDNTTLLNSHLARIENIDRELASLRAELERRAVEAAAPSPPPPPQAAPLRVSRHVADTSDPLASTTWLLERVSRIEDENRSALKDLIGKLSAPPRRTN